MTNRARRFGPFHHRAAGAGRVARLGSARLITRHPLTGPNLVAPACGTPRPKFDPRACNVAAFGRSTSKRRQPVQPGLCDTRSPGRFRLGPVPRRLRRAFDPPPCQLPHAAANDGDSVRTSRTNTPWFVIKHFVIKRWHQVGNAARGDRRVTGSAGGPDPGRNACAAICVHVN